MKHLFFYGTVLIMTSFFASRSYSQVGSTDADEQYCRANIGYTSFMILGVSETKFAKCVKAQNYLEPGKTSGVVDINGEQYEDDGRNNDLAANDGILTSILLFDYKRGATKVPVREYRVVGNSFVSDPGFQHGEKIEMNRVKVSCTFIWVKCSSWPPDIQDVCRRLCWPFHGYIAIKECSVGFEFF